MSATSLSKKTILKRLQSFYRERTEERKKPDICASLLFDYTLWTTDDTFEKGSSYVTWFNRPRSFIAMRPGILREIKKNTAQEFDEETLETILQKGDYATLCGFHSLAQPGNIFDLINRLYYGSIPGDVYHSESSVPDAISSDPLFAVARAHDVYNKVIEKQLSAETVRILYLGAGRDLQQATAFLDELQRLDTVNQTAVYKKVQVIMSDYSETIVRDAQKQASTHSSSKEHVANRALHFQVVDAFTPEIDHISWIYGSYLYDSISRPMIAKVDGAYYEIQYRAYIQETAEFQRTDGTVISAQEFRTYFETQDVGKLATCRPACFEHIKLEEKLVPIDIHQYHGGAILEALLQNVENVTCELSTATYVHIKKALACLVPGGILEAYDMGDRRVEEMDELSGKIRQVGAVYVGLNFPFLEQLATADDTVAVIEPALHYVRRALCQDVLPLFKLYKIMRSAESEDRTIPEMYFPRETLQQGMPLPSCREITAALCDIQKETLWLYSRGENPIFVERMDSLGFDPQRLKRHLFQHLPDLEREVAYTRLFLRKK